MYHVVEFMDESGKSLAVAAENWFLQEKGLCYWPSVSNPGNYAKNKKAPENNTKWRLIKARCLHSYDSYDKARSNLHKYEDHTDVTSDSDEEAGKKRAVNVPARYQSPALINNSKSKLKVFPHQIVLNEALLQKEDHSDTKANPKEPERLIQTIQMQENDETVNSDACFGINELAPYLNETERRQMKSSDDEEGPHNSNSNHKTDLSTPNSAEKGVTNYTLKETLRKIVADLAMIKASLTNFEKRFDGIGLTEPKSRKPSQKIIMKPFGSVEEFQDFDNSEVDADALQQEMLLVGGDSVVDLIGRILRKMFPDEVAAKISLHGLQGNVNFSNTKMWTILKRAVLLRKSINPDEKLIEKATMNWFRHANDRLKAKNKKAS